MQGLQYFENGILKKQWDDATTTFTQFDVDGAPVPGTPRPYTATEVLEAQGRTHAALHDTNKALILQETGTLKAELKSLRTRTADTPFGAGFKTTDEILATSNADINAAPAAYINSLARICNRTIQGVIDLIKITNNDLDTLN